MVKIGMSAPAAQWASRLIEVGGVDARRLFGSLDNPGGITGLAKSELGQNRMPIMSFKIANNDWAGVAAGVYDSQLMSLSATLGSLPGTVFVTLHHEPAKDGTPADYAAMLTHALPILGSTPNVLVGPIVHGFWWSGRAGQALTDREIAAWLPPSVLRVSDVVAADCYHGGTAASPGENAAPKMQNLSKWATRVGVQKLGVGEYNGLGAADVTAAGQVLTSDPKFVFGCIFNSNTNNRDGVQWVLTGDRIKAFRETVAASRQTGPVVEDYQATTTNVVEKHNLLVRLLRSKGIV